MLDFSQRLRNDLFFKKKFIGHYQILLIWKLVSNQLFIKFLTVVMLKFFIENHIFSSSSKYVEAI